MSLLGSVSMEDINTAWKQFVEEGILNRKVVRPIVAESWLRCKKLGVNPYLTKKEVVGVPQKILDEKRNKNRRLLEIARPFMKTLYEFLSGSEFLVFMSDTDGIIIELIGDEVVNQFTGVKNYNMLVLDLNEKVMGTNSHVLALLEKRPVQIIAKEHYCSFFHNWSSSAAPILNGKGDLLGVLSVSGNYKKVHPHTLGMVVAAVKAIENELRLDDTNRELRMSYGYSNTIIESISEGLLSLDVNGKITFINAIAKKMLGYEEKKPNISSYPFLRILNEVSKTGCVLNNKEISNKKGERFVISVVPIKVDLEDPAGAVVILKESRAVHRFVADIVGANSNFTFRELIGKSDIFLKSVSLAKRASLSDSIILLQGESGTGKDLFAQAIHNNSNRKAGPFIAINCAALPHELIGSELFGYEEGAFTGAKKGGHIGKFELSNGGTLFLDEVGDMPLDLQAHLLRVLEEKKITRLGGHKFISVDVRVIAATNKNLKELVRLGHFREDLYYRLNVLSIMLPPLRERGDDLFLLTDNFINRLNRRLGKDVQGLGIDTIKLFKSYDWPGNVRELQNYIERAIHLTDQNILLREHFPGLTYYEGEKIIYDKKEDLKTILKEHERSILLSVLNKYNWNITKAAKALGVARNTLYYKIDKLGVECPNNLTMSNR